MTQAQPWVAAVRIVLAEKREAELEELREHLRMLERAQRSRGPWQGEE
jgi:hypothetical protein